MYGYNQSFWQETIVSEWDLVCSLSSLPVVSKMIFFSGFAVGTFVAGIVSDIWGRKRSILLFSFLMLVSGLATSFMPVFPSFVVMWWLVGVAAVANFTVAFVWTIELAAGSGRETLFSKLYSLFQANGKLSLECQCSSHGLLVEV